MAELGMLRGGQGGGVLLLGEAMAVRCRSEAIQGWGSPILSSCFCRVKTSRYRSCYILCNASPSAVLSPNMRFELCPPDQTACMHAREEGGLGVEQGGGGEGRCISCELHVVPPIHPPGQAARPAGGKGGPIHPPPGCHPPSGPTHSPLKAVLSMAHFILSSCTALFPLPTVHN